MSICAKSLIITLIFEYPNASINSSCAQPLGYCGELPALSFPRGRTLANFRCPGIGHLPTPGPPPSFWHVRGFLSEYNYTEDFTGKISILAHLSRTEKKLRRVVKACSRFYACISSLLIKPELLSEIGSYGHKSTFFWLLNQISVDCIWRTSFYNYTTSGAERITLQNTINFNVNNFITVLKP